MKFNNLLICVSLLLIPLVVSAQNETMPEFPGGEPAFQWYLRSHIVYPDSAIDNELEGMAFVYFEIDTGGAISNVKIKKSTGSACLDSEAVRVIRTMPKWTPGSLNGKKVKVSLAVPIKFVLMQEDVDRRKKEKKEAKKAERRK